MVVVLVGVGLLNCLQFIFFNWISLHKMLHNVCRICAIDTDTTKSQNLFEATRPFIRQIKLLTGVFLEDNPSLPNVICLLCQNDLMCAIDFRERCVQNHERWMKYIKKIADSSPTTLPVISLRRSTRSRWAKQHDGEEAPLNPIEIKVENLDEVYVKDHTDHHETGKCDDGSENVSSLKDEKYMPPINTKQRRRLVHDRVEKQIRTKQKLPVFFCDQCGNNVTGKAAFDRHLRKHSGIRPFQCEHCSGSFLSSGELKGHQVMHTGDRKFACRYCDRSYVNYSGRLRHERTHTNDRPFVCVHCGKAFTNSYILKNHILVHTGERLFRCDLCERSFSRPTHLKTHYRSNTHKLNVEKSCLSQQEELKSDRTQPIDEVSLLQSNMDCESVTLATLEVPLNQ